MSDALALAIDHALDAAVTAAARDAVQVFVLDTLGVGIAGARLSERAALLALSGSAADAREPVRVLGDGRGLACAQAAALNAWQIHNQEYDCVHEGAVVHPMAVIGGVLLALSDRAGARGQPVSGARLIEAVAVAVDIAVTVGLCARQPMRFFRPAMAGALGALAGAGRLLGLDAVTLRSAYGLLLAQLSGTMQAHREGSPALALQIGFNARATIDALDLALAGIAGPRDALEGPFGYFALYEPGADLAPFTELGRIARIAEVSHKPYPTGRAAHAALDALAMLDQQQPIDAARVETITLTAPPLIVRLIARPPMVQMSSSYARLCLGYLVACWLQQRTVRLSDFDPAALADPARLALAQRVRVLDSGTLDPNAMLPQRVRVALDSGETRELELDAVLGSPARPLDRTAQLAKFDACLDAAPMVFQRAQRADILDAVSALPTLADVRQLIGLCCVTTEGKAKP